MHQQQKSLGLKLGKGGRENDTRCRRNILIVGAGLALFLVILGLALGVGLKNLH